MAMFYMPVKVYEESEAVLNHAADIAKFGKKALIVTGRRSAYANGSYDDIIAALAGNGVDHVVFNEVEENPSVNTIMKARDFGIAQGADFVIGVGGGSPLDASKAIALMIKKADKDASYLYKPDGADRGYPDDLWYRIGSHAGICPDGYGKDGEEVDSSQDIRGPCPARWQVSEVCTEACSQQYDIRCPDTPV